MKPTSSEVKEKRKSTDKKLSKYTESGIESFFQKAEVFEDRLTPEVAKIPDDEPMTKPGEKPPFQSDPKPKFATPRREKKSIIKVVDPPTFHPVRAMTSDQGFVQHLKVREFVLQCTLPLFHSHI